ncbi:hypothetical protein K503DRAFT_130149 [Rhizopogon vinicolor AM-OR11-026]|uniref:Hydrophobin n=1 Tax=Rhizopogon vinicolor AM-OR11-026 TaxID=1314800 RepID=A0A1B7N1Y1_9AGAM|nr:hypothetical protein K503DRAFT_130149 [Rhizopogon vinicolor AM-OR11-026]
MLSQFLIASTLLLPIVASTEACNSGNALCCNITTTDAKDILTAYSISDSELTSLVGLNCSIADTVSYDESVSQCVEPTVCCTETYYGGTISVNCSVTVSS